MHHTGVCSVSSPRAARRNVSFFSLGKPLGLQEENQRGVSTKTGTGCPARPLGMQVQGWRLVPAPRPVTAGLGFAPSWVHGDKCSLLVTSQGLFEGDSGALPGDRRCPAPGP